MRGPLSFQLHGGRAWRPRGASVAAASVLVASVLVASVLAGCVPPAVDDDDFATANDDDAANDDDDANDDDATADDDDVADDDDDTPAPSTTLTITSPQSGTNLSVINTFSAQIDGDAPGLATMRIDGDVVAQGFFNVATGVFQAELDTGAWPDGTYTLQVEATAWGLSDSRELTFLNGDLLRYDFASVPYAYQAQSPVPSPLTLVPSAVSLMHMVAPQAGDPWDTLFGYALNPDGDWAIGGPETTLYPLEAAWGAPWAGAIPNHPNEPWRTGTYNLYPWGDQTADGNDFDLTALVKRSFGTVQAGRLDLDFYFVSGVTLTASSAAGSSTMANYIDGIEQILLQADIAVGDVGYYDVPASSFGNIADYDELIDLFDQGVPSDDRVLNVFLVNNLNMSGSNPLGVAAHIPGPALMSGTGQAGIAVVDQYLQSNQPGTAAALTAHEIGHYLGLYHSTEVGGGVSDPLLDTPPSCNAGSCWDTNLMDPYLNDDTSLSPDQRYVLLRHALVELIPASQLPARVARDTLDFADGLPPGGLGPFCGSSR
jgi:hypothetical protein